MLSMEKCVCTYGLPIIQHDIVVISLDAGVQAGILALNSTVSNSYLGTKGALISIIVPSTP